jgi:5-methylcytosine-specific restriction protein B
LSFGSDHDWLVRCFLCSALAKPLLILTGLSGSGKTQLALKLGEWLGEHKYRVVPVRPDWTGPEWLLGYEDALLPVEQSRRAWHVPEALQLMIQAAHDPAQLYLLILDEMNLAHVERYFADVLSGIESREPVIPNLGLDDTGHWRIPPGQPPKLEMPRNLIIVGTVNADETTYMFSPKVLDRANTIEFRVSTDALPIDPARIVRPTRCAAASARDIASLLRICLDDAWQAGASSRISKLATLIRQVHGGLSVHGFEFGHRTYYEGLRLAALLDACGVDDGNDILDVFVLQKVLPRLNGSRRKLEPVLRSLGAFAFEKHAVIGSAADFDVLAPPAGKQPVLRRTFAKVARLMRALHANQFASFAD